MKFGFDWPSGFREEDVSIAGSWVYYKLSMGISLKHRTGVLKTPLQKSETGNMGLKISRHASCIK